MMQNFLNQARIELKIRNYSPKTVKSYLYALREYFSFKKHNFEQLDIENIKKFLLQRQESNLSPQTINLQLNAINFCPRAELVPARKIWTAL